MGDGAWERGRSTEGKQQLFGMIRHAVAVGVARSWLASSKQSWRQLPRPERSAVTESRGPDPDRILLLGSGIAVGYGVVTHELALAGHLARHLASLTGRGASVAVLASPQLDCAKAREILRLTDLSRYDAIVLTLGGFDGLTFLTVRAWKRGIRAVLDQLAAAEPRLQVFAMEIPAVALAARLPRSLRSPLVRHITRLNDFT